MSNPKTEFELEFLPIATNKNTGRVIISFHGNTPKEHRASTIWIKIDKPSTIAVIP